MCKRLNSGFPFAYVGLVLKIQMVNVVRGAFFVVRNEEYGDMFSILFSF